MPRTPRAREESGIHHVVVQGLDHQKIFEENEDKDLYLDIVLRFKERFDMRLYAYCIMPNHAHLLLKEGEIDISSFMRRVGVSFVHWYKMNHAVEGPVFRGRYMSEPLQDESQILQVARFIHQEPVKAGLVREMEEYLWSSYRLYLYQNSFIDTEAILDRLHYWGPYEEYMKLPEPAVYLEEVPPRFGKTDREVRALLLNRLSGKAIEELRYMPADMRDAILAKLRYDDKVSVTQLARVTQLGRSIIQKLKKPEE